MALREVCDRCLKPSTDGSPMTSIRVQVDAPEGVHSEALISVCANCMPKVSSILGGDLLTKASPADVAYGPAFGRADESFATAFRLQPPLLDVIERRAAIVSPQTQAALDYVAVVAAPTGCRLCGDDPCTCNDED